MAFGFYESRNFMSEGSLSSAATRRLYLQLAVAEAQCGVIRAANHKLSLTGAHTAL